MSQQCKLDVKQLIHMYNPPTIQWWESPFSLWQLNEEIVIIICVKEYCYFVHNYCIHTKYVCGVKLEETRFSFSKVASNNNWCPTVSNFINLHSLKYINFPIVAPFSLLDPNHSKGILNWLYLNSLLWLPILARSSINCKTL